ncbi:MAG: polysaccharide deacetylase family protein [Bacteroidota bacterium]|nr:MAG: polysaccharide deacetylase family protein [Bacteroidota bacterium]
MKSICFYFQVHQPMRFKSYRFFSIGHDHYYYDDYLNESVVNKVAKHCYLPANELFLKLIRQYNGKVKINFSISGVALDQFKLHVPEVIDSFRALVDTGHVELIAETYAHSLAVFKDRAEFRNQVQAHAREIKELFGVEPRVFRNTELIYSDQIGAEVAELGYQAILTEGAKHILGWKNSNFLYSHPKASNLKVLLRNFPLSDDIAFRFCNKSWAEYPLTPGKYMAWVAESLKTGEVANIFMDYETFGEHQKADTGIFQFTEKIFKEIAGSKTYQLNTISEVISHYQPVSDIQVPNPISWADEEKDLTAWLGNDLQEDAFNKLYSLTDRIKKCTNKHLLTDWKYLQASDHFYYMCTKLFSDGAVHAYFNPFNSPYDAYINYMNILSDFIARLNAAVPQSKQELELSNLAAVIQEKNTTIEKYEIEINKLKKRLKQK